MIRRFNYTGRRSISRSDVRVRLRDLTSTPSFDVDLHLNRYEFPPDGRLVVEAYRQNSLMTFPWGTVRDPHPPEDRQLMSFSSPDAILFRLRIVESGGVASRLLAEVDQLRPISPDERDSNRESLLPLKAEDLGEELWRLDFHDRPLLLINLRVVDHKSFALSPQFRAFVYPAVLREILTWVLRVEDAEFDPDDESDWRALWVKFAEQLPGISDRPTDGSEVEAWIEEAVGAFARQHRLFTQIDSPASGDTA